MAKAPKPVQPGDLFAMPLAGGRWGVCRVLRVKRQQVLVQSSPWVGDAPPADLSDPLLVQPLVKTHHSWDNSIDRMWVDDPPPADLVRLGRIPVTAAEAKLDCDTSGSWVGLRLQPLLQWRWDHERDAVLAEDAVEEAKRKAAEHEAQYGYQPLPKRTLEEWRAEKPFADWSGYTPPAGIRESRRVVRDLIDDLIACGDDEVRKFDAFRRATERLNDADGRDEPFIETVEREDICELFHHLAEAAGLPDYDVTAWRDW